MYSEALNAIISIGIIKSVLIALGVITAIVSVINWLICGFKYDGDGFNTTAGKVVTLIGNFFWPIMFVICLTVYHLPVMNQNIIIAKQVAVQLDKYADAHPESVYTPDVMLGSLDTVIKGIVSTSVELPEYIKRLANGEIVRFMGPKDPKDMTQQELLDEVNRLRNDVAGKPITK
jgi:hypothetical protein